MAVGVRQVLDGWVRQDLGSATSVLVFWLGKSSEPGLKHKRKFMCRIREAEVIEEMGLESKF